MKVETASGVRDVPREAWNALDRGGSPFLEWEFLAALEETGCVGPGTGWMPEPLVVRDQGRIVGAAPAYRKDHSQGEFVFDHGWAEGAHAAGIRYYPKVLVATPFTPVTGPRLLVHPTAESRGVRELLAQTLTDRCSSAGLSSVHVNFCDEKDGEALGALGFVRRAGYQFHWRNRGYESFDDYLASLRSKRRHQVRRERRALEEQGIVLEILEGDALPEAGLLHRLYRSTVDKFYWGQVYLNEPFFEVARRSWRDRLSVVLASFEGRPVAGAINVRGDDALFGRYWGAFADVPYLHFNVCYYAGIEHTIRRGLSRFEPGAGGEFKRLRGFDPVETTSFHHVADPRLAAAVAQFVERERLAVGRAVEILDAHTAHRRDLD